MYSKFITLTPSLGDNKIEINSNCICSLSETNNSTHVRTIDGHTFTVKEKINDIKKLIEKSNYYKIENK